jgi:hypothetical protein
LSRRIQACIRKATASRYKAEGKAQRVESKEKGTKKNIIGDVVD